MWEYVMMLLIFFLVYCWLKKEVEHFFWSMPMSTLKAAPSDRFVVVVTGGNRGIGRQISATLSRVLVDAERKGKFNAGSVVVVCSRNTAVGEKTAWDINKWLGLLGDNGRDTSPRPNVQVVAAQLDIESDNSIDALIAKLSSQCGHVDVLINNAGFAFKMVSFLRNFLHAARDTFEYVYTQKTN